MKLRADALLEASGLVEDLREARGRIMRGLVLWTDGDGREHKVQSAGETLPTRARFRIKGGRAAYVSRAGGKLAGALDAFEILVRGRRCIDLGISTGGFTDCLLQRGAKSVVGVDVAYGFVAERVRNDPRVRLLERTHVCALTPELVGASELAVADLSFISLTKVVPTLPPLLAAGADAILLVKPQFEVEPSALDAGIVRDPAEREAAVDRVARLAAAHGLTERGRAPAQVAGTKGNLEWTLALKKHEAQE